ncbi:MAG: hypothetical protein PVI97_00700 [Candidatus Thiodiazotropha sp.]|jgi:hypothetical protein
MSGGGGGGETKTEMPKWMKETAKPLAADIGSLSSTPFFPGQTYADPSQYTQQGIAGMGGIDYQPTLDYYGGVLEGGGGLTPDFQQAVMEPAVENVASRFAAAGRYGSPASVQGMTEAGMRSLAPYWNDQQRRQMQAAAALPMAQQDLWRSRLMAGGLQEMWDQKGIDEAMQRHYYDPRYQLLQQQMGLLGGLPGGGGIVTQNPGSGSALAGGLGGAISGGMAGGMLAGTEAGAFLGPWGMAGGALLGGLAGSGLLG